MVGGFAHINYFSAHDGGRDPEPHMLVNLDGINTACVDVQLARNSPLVAVECAVECADEAMRRAGNRKSSAPPDAAGGRDGVRPIAGKMGIWLDKISISAMTLDKRLAIDNILI